MPTDVSSRNPTEVLIPEARQHQRQRYLRTCILAAIGALAVAGLIAAGVVLASGTPAGGKAKDTAVPVAALRASGVLVRPVLCLAPAYRLSGPVPGPPACASPYRMTSSALNVQPIGNGFSEAHIGPDPALAAYPSSRHDTASSLVLLGQNGSSRDLLGPAVLRLSRADVTAANAVKTPAGSWTVDIRLSPAGAAQWDAAAQQSFHQLLAFDLGGHIVSTPVIQPTSTRFSSFNGKLSVSGGLSHHEAQRVAEALRAR